MQTERHRFGRFLAAVGLGCSSLLLAADPLSAAALDGTDNGGDGSTRSESAPDWAGGLRPD